MGEGGYGIVRREPDAEVGGMIPEALVSFIQVRTFSTEVPWEWN